MIYTYCLCSSQSVRLAEVPSTAPRAFLAARACTLPTHPIAASLINRGY